MNEKRTPRIREKVTGVSLSHQKQKNISFPAISSILVTFPVVKSKRDQIKNTQKRRSIVEIDRYLENNHEDQHEDFTHYIFANPLRNTIILHKTLNTHMFDMSKQSLSIAQTTPKKHNCLSLSPFKNRKEYSRFKSSKQQMCKQMEDMKIKEALLSNKKIIDGRPQKRTMVPSSNGGINKGQRYSPWRFQHLQEELMI